MCLVRDCSLMNGMATILLVFLTHASFAQPKPTTIGTERFRHFAPVNDVAFSPDGTKVASCSNDRTVRIWKTSTGEELRRYVFDTYPETVSFSPDGKTLVVGASPGIWVWNWENGDPRLYVKSTPLEFRIGNKVHHTYYRVLSANLLKGGRLAWSDRSGSIAVRDMDSGKTIFFKRHRSPISFLLGENYCAPVFSFDGKVVACHESEDVVSVSSIEKNKVICRIKVKALATMAFAPNSSCLALGCTTGSVAIWDLATGKLCRRLETGIQADTIEFAPNGKAVAMVTKGGLIRIVGLPQGNKIQEIQGPLTGVLSLRFSNDSVLLAAGGEVEAVRIWNVETGVALGPQGVHYARVSSLCLSPKGQIASVGYDGQVGVWNSQTGKRVHLLQGHKDRLLTVAFSSDGKLIASGGFGGEIRVWNAFNGTLAFVLKSAEKHILKLVFAQSDRVLVSLGGTAIEVWDISSKKKKISIDVRHKVDVICASGGSRLVTVMQEKVAIWDLATHSIVKFIDLQSPKKPTITALSPDGRMLAVASNWRVSDFPEIVEPVPSVTLYEMYTGRKIRTMHFTQPLFFGARSVFKFDAEISSMCFVGNQLVACGLEKGKIVLGKVVDGHLFCQLTGGSGQVLSLVSSENGGYLVSGNSDSTIRMWRLSEKRPKLQIESLTQERCESFWKDLSSQDARAAYQAIFCICKRTR
ncbi:MAG: hypothetical protein KatS3mg105_2863 [Gemmatales bacterium]|nr:MAG: hypothetical protein KatS3mg105_2863 [Gemmatales bacterium]